MNKIFMNMISCRSQIEGLLSPKVLWLILMILLPAELFSRDFNYTYEDKTIKYSVVDEVNKTVRVASDNNVSGKLILPEHPMDGELKYDLIVMSLN